MRYLLYVFLLLSVSFCAIAQQDTGKELIIKSINARAQYDATLAATHYNYNSYEILKIAGDPEAITGPGFKNNELRKTLMKTRVFFAEKNSTHIYDSLYGYKEVINGIKMPGFKEPVYPIYNITFQSVDVFAQPFVIYDQEYKNPLALNALYAYTYKVESDTLIEKRPTTKITFRPLDSTKNGFLYGDIYIDKETLAIALTRFYKAGEVEIRATHTQHYYENKKLWTPGERELFIRNKKTVKEFEFLGGRLAVGNEKESDPTQDVYVIFKSVASNHQFASWEFGRRWIKAVITDEAPLQPDSYWKKYRMDEPYSTDDLANFMQLDSIVDATNITRKLETLEKFKLGYIPVGPIDIDLKYLIKLNEYEAFRLGLGGTTNSRFSENFAISGYGAYGTKDGAWKSKLNIAYRLSKERNTWLNMYRTQDIAELGSANFLTDARVYSLFEPRMINISTFYAFKDYGISLQQRIIPSVISEVSLSRKRISQTTSYQFLNDGTLYDEYVLSEFTAGARWSPVSEYMRTPKGYLETRSSYPVLTGQITKGFQGLAKSNFNYFKVSGKAVYIIDSMNNSSTEFMIEGHVASGELPLTHLFHAYPNAPNKDEILQRFSATGRGSFETMYFNEFFSDRVAIFKARHKFAPFKIASFLKPELVLVSKFAIGDLQRPEEHINVNFNTLEKGYLESGLELNQLLFGFGISAAYRYGAYHLPKAADNIALKFTFNLAL